LRIDSDNSAQSGAPQATLLGSDRANSLEIGPSSR
jgi:hypothetical protein